MFDQNILMYGFLNAEKIRWLLDRGIDINHKDYLGNTAFMYACQYGSSSNIEALLQNDSLDVNLQNNKGLTALHVFAVYYYYEDDDYKLSLMHLLNDHRLDKTITDNDGNTAESLARSKGFTERANFIRDHEIIIEEFN